MSGSARVSLSKGDVPKLGPRPAAVSKGYSFASTWEQNAPLTEVQLATVSLLAQAVSERPLPDHVEQQTPREPESGVAAPEDHSQALAPTELVLHNTHQFYKWHSELESAMNFEMEEKYRSYVTTLSKHLQTCDHIMAQVDETLGLFDGLQAQHAAVATKTQALHDACERLLQEKERLVEFADALRTKLNYFDELEKMAAQFHSSALAVESAHFLPLLQRLDECIAYVGSNPQYADAGVYLLKFRQLQSRALGAVRSHVLAALRHAAAQVQAGIREAAGPTAPASPKPALLPEGAETSLLYVRFKAAASELKGVVGAMEARRSRPEYSSLLGDLLRLYCEVRLALVAGAVAARISDYAASQGLAQLTRAGCAYLLQVCSLEAQLFDHFFPVLAAAEPQVLAPLLEPLCTVLYDALRPRCVGEQDLDLLCELVDILRSEVLEEALTVRGEAAAGIKPTVLRCLADVQERLTFRTQTYLRDEIANYVPTAEDLDYPGCLERGPAPPAAATSEIEEEIGPEAPRGTYAVWYPPLERTLACLSKLYRCLDTNIFTGLAMEAVGMCSLSIQRASKLITRKATALDGQLFLIKHLLILREQIAPFDIDFAVMHKELDFSHLLGHLRGVLRRQASAAGSSTLLSFLSSGPRVLENQRDAKKELEKDLKQSCEAFILAVTKLTVEPLLSFLTKVSAVRVAGGSSSSAPLREQAFAQPAKLQEIIAKVEEALKTEFVSAVAKMRLYLQNHSTRSILFKPIKSNITEAYSQISTIVENDYTAEDRASFGLRSAHDLQAQLDAMI